MEIMQNVLKGNNTMVHTLHNIQTYIKGDVCGPKFEGNIEIWMNEGIDKAC